MGYGNIDIKLRPIKAAFVVATVNKGPVLEAIQISTFLSPVRGGGMLLREILTPHTSGQDEPREARSQMGRR